MTSTITVQQQAASLAIVHHANQYVITDGYDNRIGISQIVGTPTSQSGLFGVLRLHEKYKIPLSLHISGTFLESLAWHRPDFLAKVRELAHLGLLELIGGSYGQNMSRFFSYDHNLRQLNEELLLYETLLDWNPNEVTIFWPTERLWETETLAPVVTSHQLKNGGYKYVLLDDRLFYSTTGNPSPRKLYDHERAWDPSIFQMYRIRDGQGLCALPISYELRRNIPPRNPEGLEKAKTQLHWILDINQGHNNQCINIYADDMEKPAGAGWDPNGPSQFETILAWISERKFLHTVKLGEWAASHVPVGEKNIDTGSYFELANEFEAGEGFERWYYDPLWTPYLDYYTWSESRIREAESKGADSALIELAWKTLLASVWQTAWHTPRSGAHGEANGETGPSSWVKAIASHSRIAAIISQAAYWARHEVVHAHSYLHDIDRDHRPELVLTSDRIYAVFSPQEGGRLVYFFTTDGSNGRSVVGNPVDDWNLLKGLHDYMDNPPNHPGALSDVGYEHDVYATEIGSPAGETVEARIRNVEEKSSGHGIEKKIILERGSSEIRIEYSLPDSLTKLSVENGLSPDYLQLLRAGNGALREYSTGPNLRGWVNGRTAAWTRLGGDSVSWDIPRQARFGHGCLQRVTGSRKFTLWIGAEQS